jgi:plastocyanin
MQSRLISLVLGVTGAALLASCGSSTGTNYGGGGGGGGGGGCTPTATKICTANGSQFSPTSLTVAAGTTVTWENGDGIAHTVTSATGSADTYDMALSSGTVSHKFTAAGTYNYYCKNHGANGTPPTGMHGTITVQ